jgi:hypothetical protein
VLLRFDETWDSGSWLALPSWNSTRGCVWAAPAVAHPTMSRVASLVVAPGCFQSSVSMLHIITAVCIARTASYVPELE